jgi:nucleoprotein TPR
VQDLSGRIAEQDATYTSEVAGLQRLIEMVEAREAQSKVIVENVEQEWATANERVDRREAALRERSRTEAAEARVEELERVLEKVNHGEFPVPAPGSSVPSTPARGSTDILTQGITDLSSTVANGDGKPSPAERQNLHRGVCGPHPSAGRVCKEERRV